MTVGKCLVTPGVEERIAWDRALNQAYHGGLLGICKKMAEDGRDVIDVRSVDGAWSGDTMRPKKLCDWTYIDLEDE